MGCPVPSSTSARLSPPSSVARSSLLIAAIHNGELSQAPSRELIDELGGLSSQVIEISEQPPFEAAANTANLKNWRRNQSQLEVRWVNYRERSANKIATSIGRLVFDTRIALSPSARENAWTIRQVEQAVTAKHIAAWRALDASTAQELLVLESDAVRTDQSRTTIEELLDRPVDVPRYVNLACGLDARSIGITHLRDQTRTHINRLQHYRKAVTNTSCAYLVNRRFVGIALSHLDSAQQDAQLGIDWLFNAIFLDQAQSEDRTIDCWHAEPPVIVHGSAQGVTKSWHPNR